MIHLWFGRIACKKQVIRSKNSYFLCFYSFSSFLCPRTNRSQCSFLMRIVNRIANPEALPSLFTQSLFFKEWQERFRICNSIRDSLLKRVTVSELLPSLFKKEWLSEEWRERYALGHKRWDNCQKHTNNTFLRAIHSNHDQITCNLLTVAHEWPEQIAHGCSFVKSDESDSLTVTLLLKSDLSE